MGKGAWGKMTSSPRAMIPRRDTPLWHVWKLIEGANVCIYRLTGGWLFGKFDDAPMLILHHVGRKSGEKRTTPLVYLQDGEDIVIVGSMGGAPKNPAWFVNVRADPEVTVEIRGKRTPVTAHEATVAERERLWPRLLEMWPAWEDYTTRTDRTFPILILTPRIR